MSYQEYAQLRRNNGNNDNGTQQETRNVYRERGRNEAPARTDRPYTGSISSFSVPRRSMTPAHSISSSSTSSSLSPSNSASQKGYLGGAKGNASPTNSQWSGDSNSGTQGPKARIMPAELTDEKKPELVDMPMSWRPLYLRRRILAPFTVIVTGLAVGIGTLYDLSNRNLGLGPTSTAGHYLWRLAPTALLSLLIAVWNRIDYQANLVAPWVRLSKGPAKAEKTLLLDYLSMWQPVVVVRGFQNRDFAVACAAAVSVLLRVLVALSAGLITLSLVSGIPGAPRNMSSLSNVEVTVQSAFVDNTTDMTNAGALAFFTMVGLQQDNVYFPDGVSERFAYQKFSSDLPQGSVVETGVEGFSAELLCEAAEMEFNGMQVSRGIQQFNTTFSAGGCAISMPITSEGFVPSASGTQVPFYVARLGRGSCRDSGRAEDQRMVVVFASATMDARSPPTNTSASNFAEVNGNITTSVQLICQPTYSISRVRVTMQDSTLVGVAESRRRENRTLPGVKPWDFAEAFFGSYRSENELASLYADISPWFYQPDIVNVDAAMFLALELQTGRTGSPISPDELLNATILQKVADDYFSQYAAVLAARSLTQPTSIQGQATASTVSERLRVSPLIAKLMIILMGIVAALVATMGFTIPTQGILPRDPGTIMDMAALVSNSRGLLQVLRGAGGADQATLRARLTGSDFYTGVEAYERADSSGSGYFKIFGGGAQGTAKQEYVKEREKFTYPSLLHPVQRGAVFLITVGLIVGLDLGYQYSTRNGGLFDTDDDTYPHLLWTVVPAVVVGFVAMYYLASDVVVRSIAPFIALGRGATFEQSISLNLADRALPMAFYFTARSRNLVVGASTAAAIFSSFFVISAATLFYAATVPATAQCQLLTRDFFSQSNGIPDDGFCTFCQNGTVLSSLVLDANMSYPAFTFEDLAYPSFSLENVPDDMELPDDLVVNAVVPAVRSSLQCKSFRQSELAINLQTGSTVNGVVNPLQITLPGKADADENTVITSSAQNLDSIGNPLNTAIERDAFFGAGEYKPLADGNNTIPRWVWVWGQLEQAGTDQTRIRFAAALICNETMQQVNVATSFIGSDLHIDAEYRPPVPDEETVTSVPVAIDGNLDYSELIQLYTPHLLDPFFSSLVSSRFALPVTSLGPSSSGADEVEMIQSVVDAITRQHKIIRAQIVNTWNRRRTVPPQTSPGAAQPQSVIFPVDSSGVIMGNATTLAFPAVLTVSNLDSGAARRVVQGMISTRILQALLSATLIAAAASWLALPKPNTILPRPPTSIASMAALLADGNLFGQLGRGAEWLSLEDLRGFFKDGLHVSMNFQLGWEKVRRRRRDEVQTVVWGSSQGVFYERDHVFGVSAIRTGGWGGGENVGLGLKARVGFNHRSHVRDWGWRT
ncbi:hypothetical protein QBC37DRAFT_127616 [Rhypophila decipiens]|uniref:Uncharacterized protein n=1 Tax=Rhypophila decipiens TaxID=261697 RepID=A0AAN6YFT2_9PEZI|nr:hypothetical protein QBC37DRAFT_127616 [Rhypophila decipiens]